ncbi:MAG: GAF domain-containing protein, partial [Chloroflexota bacterium]
MSDIHTLKELRTVVEKQGKALLNAMARISSGELDHNVDIPDGVHILKDLGYGLTYLAEDMRLLARRHKELQKKYEKLKVQYLQSIEQEQKQEIEEAILSPAEPDPISTTEPIINPITNGRSLPLPSTGWLGNSPLPADQNHQNGDPLFDSSISLAPTFESPNDVLGFLGFDPNNNLQLSQEESSALEDIAEQFGLALENQILFEQTQQALLETELLYQVSALLNQAESTSEVLNALSSTISDMDGISLWVVSQEENKQSPWLKLIESWVPYREYPALPIGSRIDIANYPFLQSLLFEGHDPAMISDIREDERTAGDINLHSIIDQIGLQSFSFLPLTLGHRLVGLMVFGWMEEREFSKRDLPLFQAVSAQVSTTVDGLLQLDETKLRAAQFASLAEIESDLTRAVDEVRVVESLKTIFPEGNVSLLYSLERDGTAPTRLQIQASIDSQGQLLPAISGMIISNR